MQLHNTTIPLFQQEVLQWQRSYMENTLIISPTSLMTMADEEIQILRHSNQWVETIEPSVVAMKVLFQGNLTGTQTLFQQIQANLEKIAKSRDSSSDGASGRQYSDRPDWVFDAPTTKTEQREYHGRIWHYCTQCGRNGKWVRDSTMKIVVTGPGCDLDCLPLPEVVLPCMQEVEVFLFTQHHLAVPLHSCPCLTA